ncbi:MAG: hypothetical protein MK212_13955 [Saprospiraceae bacterium]|nr:hypothetical protein [Saprospiraceae bacterium]
MKTGITAILLICSIALGFAQNKGEVKRYGFLMDIPKDWQVNKYKDYTEINDKNLDITVIIREIQAQDKDEILEIVRKQVYRDVVFYISNKKVDEKMKVAKGTNKKGLDYLRLYLESDPDEDNQVMIYDARIFKNKEKVVMISIEDFAEGLDPNNELDFLIPKFWDETDKIWSSIQLK